MCYSVNAQGPDDETAPLPAPAAQVNVNGGAIALGHPLGATGARCTATLLHEMRRRGKAARFGVVSMCIGSGMGAAAVFERGGEVDGLANARAVTGQTHLSRDARM
jgi:acetyl-CoA acyltransferase 1